MFDKYDSPVIELEPEVNLEFSVHTYDFSPAQSLIGGKAIQARDRKIEELLNAGWQIEDKILCPPLVTLIFSREKEEKETDNE